MGEPQSSKASSLPRLILSPKEVTLVHLGSDASDVVDAICEGFPEIPVIKVSDIHGAIEAASSDKDRAQMLVVGKADNPALSFTCLTLLEQGFRVFAAIPDPTNTAFLAFERLRAAGVILLPLQACLSDLEIASELARNS